MNDDDIKLLLSRKSIISFLIILSIILVIAIMFISWSEKKSSNTHNTVLLSTLSIFDYNRYMSKEYIDYVNQDFDKLSRNNLQCNMKENVVIILKQHDSKSCHQGTCHLEIGYFNYKGELIKYYESR